jgi:hypothetical protein
MSLREYIESRSIPVPFAGCWLWLLSCGSHGYGNASTVRERVTTAHRVSFEAFKGSIPSGMLVQHSCDNKWCVNPDHLSLGTDATNAIDKQLKGRAAKRLTSSDVREIRERVAAGEHIRVVAQSMGIGASTVQRVAARSKGGWQHVA